MTAHNKITSALDLQIFQKCNILRFQKCVGKVDFEDGYTFNVTTPQQFKENCDAKLEAVKCAEDYISDCFSDTEYLAFETLTRGKLKLVKDLCTQGTELNKAYFKNMECWEKMAKDVQFCNSKFEESQNKINQGPLDEQLKIFHSCCAFDWLKQCKTKSVEARCDHDAKSYIDKVTGMLGGVPLNKMCGAVVNQPGVVNCYELYGVEVDSLDDLFSSNNKLIPSLLVLVLSFLLLI